MRVSMESRVEGLIKQLQGVTDKSVCVGFGVSKPEQVRGRSWRTCCLACRARLSQSRSG
jgi:tryptophan synthase alpha chain